VNDPLSAIERARDPIHSRALDAASDLLVNDGVAAVSLRTVAKHASVDLADLEELFSTSQQLVTDVVNREYAALFALIVDHVDRDPLGGLLSHIYRQMLSAVKQRPLSDALFQQATDVMSSILGEKHGHPQVSQLPITVQFVDQMKSAGMIRADVDSSAVAAVLSTVSAGTAVASPAVDLEAMADGLTMMLERGVDADVVETSAGKALFLSYIESRVGLAVSNLE
jgi:AcrR family transcriptional regulator